MKQFEISKMEDYEPGGREFESLRARHFPTSYDTSALFCDSLRSRIVDILSAYSARCSLDRCAYRLTISGTIGDRPRFYVIVDYLRKTNKWGQSKILNREDVIYFTLTIWPPSQSPLRRYVNRGQTTFYCRDYGVVERWNDSEIGRIFVVKETMDGDCRNKCGLSPIILRLGLANDIIGSNYIMSRCNCNSYMVKTNKFTF